MRLPLGQHKQWSAKWLSTSWTKLERTERGRNGAVLKIANWSLWDYDWAPLSHNPDPMAVVGGLSPQQSSRLRQVEEKRMRHLLFAWPPSLMGAWELTWEIAFTTRAAHDRFRSAARGVKVNARVITQVIYSHLCREWYNCMVINEWRSGQRSGKLIS